MEIDWKNLHNKRNNRHYKGGNRYQSSKHSALVGAGSKTGAVTATTLAAAILALLLLLILACTLLGAFSDLANLTLVCCAQGSASRQVLCPECGNSYYCTRPFGATPGERLGYIASSKLLLFCRNFLENTKDVPKKKKKNVPYPTSQRRKLTTNY